MNLKVTIDIGGASYTKEKLVDEQSSLIHVVILNALQDLLLDSGVIDKGYSLEVVNREESRVLEQAGY